MAGHHDGKEEERGTNGRKVLPVARSKSHDHVGWRAARFVIACRCQSNQFGTPARNRSDQGERKGKNMGKRKRTLKPKEA